MKVVAIIRSGYLVIPKRKEFWGKKVEALCHRDGAARSLLFPLAYPKCIVELLEQRFNFCVIVRPIAQYIASPKGREQFKVGGHEFFEAIVINGPYR